MTPRWRVRHQRTICDDGRIPPYRIVGVYHWYWAAYAVALVMVLWNDWGESIIEPFP